MATVPHNAIPITDFPHQVHTRHNMPTSTLTYTEYIFTTYGDFRPITMFYRIKMDENGAQECGMDFYAQFNSLKALEKKFLKSNHWFSLAVQSPAGQTSPIWQSGLLGRQDSVQPMKTGG